MWFFLVRLCPLACLASVYVLADVCLNVRPPIIAGYEFLGLVSTQVSCYATVMVFLYDVLSQLLVLWNVQASLPCNDPVFFDISFVVLE